MKSVYALSAILSSIVPATAMAMDVGNPIFLTTGSAQNSTLAVESAPAMLPMNDFANALAPYARAGWQAPLSTLAHNVRGTVTIVDADTFRVDNFFYDGGGINVHFILAASNNNTLFRTAGLVTEPNLLGTAHNGDSITIDLPAGTTFDGYGAISLWCIPASANFGSGTFASPVPEPTSAALLALGLTPLVFLRRRRAFAAIEHHIR
jgi:Electron transfer DM13